MKPQWPVHTGWKCRLAAVEIEWHKSTFMKFAGLKRSTASRFWLAALIGFAAGILGGAAYLLLGGSYIFNVPLWASIAFYPGFLAGNLAYDHWHFSRDASVVIGVFAVGLGYGSLAAVAGWLGNSFRRRRLNRVSQDNSSTSLP